MTEARTYRGGRVAPADDEAPKQLRFACNAHQCPMPGTIFPASGSNGVCAWHYGGLPSDWPRITQVLRDWQCMVDEIDECRRIHSGASGFDPKVLSDTYAAAIARLRPFVQGGGWGDAFEPKHGEQYRDWGRRLEAFLGGEVVKVLNLNHRRAA